MPKYKKLFYLGIILTIVPIILLVLDNKFLNCIDGTKVFFRTLGYVDTGLSYFVLPIPFGIVFLIASFCLYNKFHGKTDLYIIYEVLLILGLVFILLNLIFSSLNSARSKGPNAAVKASLSSLRATAEMYYEHHHKNYSGFCTTEEFLKVKEYLENNQPNDGLLCRIPNKEVYCMDSREEYAVLAKLLISSSEGNYWCVDSSGFSGSVMNPVLGTKCQH